MSLKLVVIPITTIVVFLNLDHRIELCSATIEKINLLGSARKRKYIRFAKPTTKRALSVCFSRCENQLSSSTSI